MCGYTRKDKICNDYIIGQVGWHLLRIKYRRSFKMVCSCVRRPVDVPVKWGERIIFSL